MKRVLSLALALVLTLTACTGGPNEAAKTPEELTRAYEDAITAARSEELNEVYPLMTDGEDELSEMVFTILGLTPEDMTAFAIAVSLRNVSAYGIAAIMPAEGREEAVMTGLETFVENQKTSFERYLEDQYAIAAAARLESLEDGTVLLVMCEDQDAVFDSIKSALEG